MPESTSPTPLPPADGANPNPTTPELTVLPSPRARQVGLTLRQMEALSLTVAIIDAARQPDYATTLSDKGMDAAFLTALELDVAHALGHGRTALGSSATSKDVTQQHQEAEQNLVSALQALQAAARLQHLPGHPELLEKYHIGKKLTASRAVLETLSQHIIAQANEERPGSTDTEVITRATALHAAYVAPAAAQTAAKGQGKQARGQRDALITSIVARRKKIQYAADSLWPSKRPEHLQARTAFHLPADRPYSY